MSFPRPSLTGTSRRPTVGQTNATGSRLQRWLVGEGSAILGLLILAVLVGSLYALIIRPWAQPDEPRHFEVALHVARLHKPRIEYADRVLAWEQEIIAAMEAESFWWYGYTLVGWDPAQLPTSFDAIFGPQYGLAFFQAPLYYYLAGQWLRLHPNLPLSEAVIQLRLLGLGCLVASLLAIYGLTRELFPHRPRLTLAVLMTAALWPSHLAANAAVNNDLLVEALVAWALFLAVRIVRRGPGLLSLLWLLLLGLAAAQTKRSGLVVLVFLPLAPALWGWGRWHVTWRRQGPALAGGTAAALVLALLVLRFGRLYLPDDFGRALASGAYRQDLLTAPYGRFLLALLKTFMGWFGWMRLELPAWLYGMGAVVGAVGWLGAWVTVLRPQKVALTGWQRRGLVLLFMALILQLGLTVGKEIVFGTWRDGSLPQARYLYPVLAALIVPPLWGWACWWPRRGRSAALILGFLALLAFNVYVLAFLLYPFFWL
jgi:hypothetical protein